MIVKGEEVLEVDQVQIVGRRNLTSISITIVNTRNIDARVTAKTVEGAVKIGKRRGLKMRWMSRKSILSRSKKML